ncbi:MAG: xanthine dehydrogenase family protein subunit M, partial [Anaerolineae bacterium]|nr:xanthine dehydrogenase family protein subunit M [Thermoflexales bacterium]MDW8408988.1 xanthine dehydrogenase family protein subunit M [Anaerolineae bacterium]
MPSTLEEAVVLLGRHSADQHGARVIAGGTDLVLELERGLRRVGALIDISRLADQNRIWLDEAGWLHLGPLATHADVVASSLCVERAFPLAQACREVGAPQIRNRGTVAGNLITASPANDTITPLMALGARVTLRSTRGSRVVPLDQFYLGVRRTVMQADEIMTDVAFPALNPATQAGAFLKLGLRQAQAIAIVNCAAVLTFDAAGRVADAAIALGAVAPTIVRATGAEAALRGQFLDERVIEQAAELARRAAVPIDDVRAGADYRRRMTAVLVRRVLTHIAQGNERAGWNEPPACLRINARRLDPVSELPVMLLTSDVIQFTVNGRSYSVTGAQHKTLLR